MSKKSRTFQPGTTGQPGPTPSTPEVTPDTATQTVPGGSAASAPKPPTTPTTSTSSRPSSATRAEQRRTASSQGPRATQPQSFFEKYRALILGGAAVAVVAIVLLIIGMGANTKAYECVTLLTPPPAAAPASPVFASPGASDTAPATTTPDASGAPAGSATPGTSPAASVAPEPTPELGFVTQDLGKSHVSTNVTVKYGYCPPASGSHYNIAGQAPLTRNFYGPDTKLVPGNWIHNLEHGYVVILYRGDADQAILDGIQEVMAQATATPETAQRCGYNKVIGVRFDDMDPSVQVAALAWDRALLQTEFDQAELLAFANQWQDSDQITETGLC